MESKAELTPLVRYGKKIYIEGRRITVEMVAEIYTDLGWSAERIAEEFDLSLGQVHGALSYYFDHKEEIDEQIKEHQKPIEGPNVINGADILSGKVKLMMTTTEVAETYGISDRTVREAIEKGWINARKSGGTWLIRTQDAEKRWGSKKG